MVLDLLMLSDQISQILIVQQVILWGVVMPKEKEEFLAPNASWDVTKRFGHCESLSTMGDWIQRTQLNWV